MSIYQKWVTDRAALVANRNELREKFYVQLLPTLSDWAERRDGADPVTGKRIFTMVVDDEEITTRASSNRWVKAVVITAFDGRSKISLEIPDDAVHVVLKMDSTHHVYAYIDPTPHPQLRDASGIGRPLSIILDQFEASVLHG
jgi:hypothetical protein